MGRAMGFLGNIGKQLGGSITRILTGPQMDAFQNALVTDHRKAFVTILMAAAADASKKPNFNLELEMNDLWTSLTVLKQSKPAGLPNLSGMLGSLGGTASGLVRVIEETLRSGGR